MPQIGDMSIRPVDDGVIYFDPTVFYDRTTPADWEDHRDLLDAEGRLELAIGGFLVTGGDRVVLVDLGAGAGYKVPRADADCRRSGELIESLAALGYRPDDVTDVVFTHLHFDHVGWCATDGEVTFRKARHWCDAADWDHFYTRAGEGHLPDKDLKIAPRLEPIADRIEFWDGDGPILPGVDVLSAPGHTPGSAVIVVSSGEERALLLGDTIHCPVELLDEEWGAVSDVDPVLAQRTRERLADEMEGTGALTSASHFPEMRFGRLLPAKGKTRWVFA